MPEFSMAYAAWPELAHYNMMIFSQATKNLES
jgi:hypothetical protein